MYTRYHAYKSATHRFFITEACLKKGSVIYYPANMDQVEAKYPKLCLVYENRESVDRPSIDISASKMNER